MLYLWKEISNDRAASRIISSYNSTHITQTQGCLPVLSSQFSHFGYYGSRGITITDVKLGSDWSLQKWNIKHMNTIIVCSYLPSTENCFLDRMTIRYFNVRPVQVTCDVEGILPLLFSRNLCDFLSTKKVERWPIQQDVRQNFKNTSHMTYHGISINFLQAFNNNLKLKIPRFPLRQKKKLTLTEQPYFFLL